MRRNERIAKDLLTAARLAARFGQDMPHAGLHRPLQR